MVTETKVLKQKSEWILMWCKHHHPQQEHPRSAASPWSTFVSDVFFLSGSAVVVQICNALVQNVLPPAMQDPNLNYICVKRIADALGVQQVKAKHHPFSRI